MDRTACLVTGGVLMAMSAIACGGGEKPAADKAKAAPAVRVYVTNEASGDLTVLDAATQDVVGTIPVGKRPRGIKVSPTHKFLYVALSGSPSAGPGVSRDSLPPPDRSADGIGEIDVATGRLMRVIHAGVDPETLDVSADGSQLYVSNEDTGQLSIVDVKSGAVTATVKLAEEPEGVTIRPDGKVVYVTSEGDSAVFAVDTATHAVVQRIEVGARPRSIAFLPDGSRAYVTLENEGVVAVIDGSAHKLLQKIELGGEGATPKPRPMGTAVSPDGATLLVTSGSFGKLFWIDTAKDQPIASVAVGQRPWGVAITRDGKTAFTANGPSNDVSVVDVASRQVVKRVSVGTRPWGVAILDETADRR